MSLLLADRAVNARVAASPLRMIGGMTTSAFLSDVLLPLLESGASSGLSSGTSGISGISAVRSGYFLRSLRSGTFSGSILMAKLTLLIGTVSGQEKFTNTSLIGSFLLSALTFRPFARLRELVDPVPGRSFAGVSTLGDVLVDLELKVGVEAVDKPGAELFNELWLNVTLLEGVWWEGGKPQFVLPP